MYLRICLSKYEYKSFQCDFDLGISIIVNHQTATQLGPIPKITLFIEFQTTVEAALMCFKTACTHYLEIHKYKILISKTENTKLVKNLMCIWKTLVLLFTIYIHAKCIGKHKCTYILHLNFACQVVGGQNYVCTRYFRPCFRQI